MRHFLAFFLTALLSQPAQAQMKIKSQFELLLSEPLFDQVITDFWGALRGTQEIAIPDLTVTPQGLPVYISGVRAEINYEFPLPKRSGAAGREWELSTEKLSARLFIDKIRATGRILRVFEGTRVWVNVNGACDQVVFRLPAGASHLSARVRADVTENRVRLSLPSYNADWKPDSWQVEALRCSGIEGLEDVVVEEAKRALSTFRNFDEPVQREIAGRFKRWSEQASALLFSQQELPTGRDYVRVTVQPATARETGAGLLLGGTLNFIYPEIAPGEDLVRAHALDAAPRRATADAGNLLLPWGLSSSLLEAQFAAGRLAYAGDSNLVPDFADYMKDREAQRASFPELTRYAEDATFGLDFRATAAPRFAGARPAGANVIAGDLHFPVAMGLRAPLATGPAPMVEFHGEIAGPAALELTAEGNVVVQATPLATPVSYAWDPAYVARFHPNEFVAAEGFAEKFRGLVLGAGAVPLPFPALSVGTLKLAPNGWGLEGTNLRVNFAVSSSPEQAERTAAKKERMRRASRLRAAARGF